MSAEQEALLLAQLGPRDGLTVMLDGDSAGTSCTRDVTSRLISKIFIKVVALKEGEQPDKLDEEKLKKLLP